MRGGGYSVVFEQCERQTVIRGQSAFGYDYKSLVHRLPTQHMEPFLFTFPERIGEEVSFEHEGEEFVFVLSGRVRFFLDGEELILDPGDAPLLRFHRAAPRGGGRRRSEGPGRHLFEASGSPGLLRRRPTWTPVDRRHPRRPAMPSRESRAGTGPPRSVPFTIHPMLTEVSQ